MEQRDGTGPQETMIMQSTFGQVQDRTQGRHAPNGATSAASSPTVKEIPYDYVATFALQGNPGNRVQDVINISTDGAFVAMAIGYSFIAARLPSNIVRSPAGVANPLATLPLFG